MVDNTFSQAVSRAIGRRSSFSWGDGNHHSDRDGQPEHLFRLFDPANVGSISYGDFKKSLRQINVPLSDTESEDIARKYDSHDDGEVDYRRFLADTYDSVTAETTPFVTRSVRSLGPSWLVCAPMGQQSTWPGKDPDRTDTPTGAAASRGLRRVARRLGGRSGPLRTALRRMDGDNDGRISHDEFVRGLRSIGIDLEMDVLQEFIRQYDPAGRGAVDVDRFTRDLDQAGGLRGVARVPVALTRLREAAHRQLGGMPLSRVLRQFDPRREGALSAADLRHALRKVGIELHEEDAEALQESKGISRAGKVDYVALSNALDLGDDSSQRATVSASLDYSAPRNPSDVREGVIEQRLRQALCDEAGHGRAGAIHRVFAAKPTTDGPGGNQTASSAFPSPDDTMSFSEFRLGLERQGVMLGNADFARLMTKLCQSNAPAAATDEVNGQVRYADVCAALGVEPSRPPEYLLERDGVLSPPKRHPIFEDSIFAEGPAEIRSVAGIASGRRAPVETPWAAGAPWGSSNPNDLTRADFNPREADGQVHAGDLPSMRRTEGKKRLTTSSTERLWPWEKPSREVRRLTRQVYTRVPDSTIFDDESPFAKDDGGRVLIGQPRRPRVPGDLRRRALARSKNRPSEGGDESTGRDTWLSTSSNVRILRPMEPAPSPSPPSAKVLRLRQGPPQPSSP